MADDTTSPSGATPSAPNGAATNGAEPPAPARSIREVAEATYDDLTADDTPAAAPEGEPSGQPTPPRDSLGRFVPKDQQGTEPGEQPAAKPTQPREDHQPTEPPHPAPAQPGEAAQPPANWSAEDKALFNKQTPEAKQFLLRRHSEMEGDYQRRVQANTRAAEFTNGLEPVFRDPVIAGSLQQNNVSPQEAIYQWAGFHKRAMSPNVEDRVHLLFDLAARMQIDPAVFAPSRSGPGAPPLSEKELADPAIKFFADTLGKTSTEVQALRGELQRMQRAAEQQQNAETLRVTRWTIDNFADEKGPDGKPLRPDFDQVLDQIIELMRVNPNRDIKEAYETARWMNATTRQGLITAERASVEQKAANQRAAQAVRSNVRGLTSPVSKPVDEGAKKGLRATLEASAEEVGWG